MDKGFHFDAGFTDRGNFFAGELAGNHDSGNAMLFCPEGTFRRVNGHLRGSVNGHVRGDLPDQFQQSEVLYQKCIYAQPDCRFQKLYQCRELRCKYQRVDCQVQLCPIEVAEFRCPL